MKQGGERVSVFMSCHVQAREARISVVCVMEGVEKCHRGSSFHDEVHFHRARRVLR